MAVALLLCRLTLAMVFAVAGGAKLVDRVGSRQAFVDFGVPVALAPLLGSLLTFTELVVAIAILPTRSSWWASLGALIMLGLFIGAISVNMARGRAPNCHCFGQLHSAPVGLSTLARNVVLAGVAAFVLWGGKENRGISVMTWLNRPTPGQSTAVLALIILLCLFVMESWFLVQLFQQHGRLLLRLDALEANLAGKTLALPVADQSDAGLSIGTPAPAFRLTGLDGETVTLETLQVLGKAIVLIFSDPGCGPCSMLLPHVARWQRDFAETLTIALISRGGRSANHAKSTEHGLINVLLQDDFEVAEAYHVSGTPSAVLVHPDGTIGSPVAVGADTIRGLVETIAPDPAPRPLGMSDRLNRRGADLSPIRLSVTRVGHKAPALKLHDLSGQLVDLAALWSGPTLVVFWNPGCGFCRQMLSDLRAWEARTALEELRLLVISTGTIEENRALRLRSLVVLDEGFEAGRAFGASGTPSGVLVDATGTIASDVAVGATAVFALAQVGQSQLQASLAV